SIVSIGAPPALEVKVEPTSLKIPQGGSIKLKVALVRKSHDGPVAVELKNLPTGLEGTKATIEKGKTAAEITLTARPTAELGSRADICALASATLNSGPQAFASGQIAIQVLRK